jgi:hypothetical protein
MGGNFAAKDSAVCEAGLNELADENDPSKLARYFFRDGG